MSAEKPMSYYERLPTDEDIANVRKRVEDEFKTAGSHNGQVYRDRLALSRWYDLQQLELNVVRGQLEDAWSANASLKARNLKLVEAIETARRHNGTNPERVAILLRAAIEENDDGK